MEEMYAALCVLLHACLNTDDCRRRRAETDPSSTSPLEDGLRARTASGHAALTDAGAVDTQSAKTMSLSNLEQLLASPKRT